MEYFDHPADIGIRGIGRDIREAFREAGRCVLSVIADPKGFHRRAKVAIECFAESREELLLEFLNQLITQSAIRRYVFTDVEISALREDKNGLSVKAVAHGEPIKNGRSRYLRKEIKGATYSQLKVYRKGSRTVAQCVVDV
jgi:SHS2 domain-containing protein